MTARTCEALIAAALVLSLPACDPGDGGSRGDAATPSPPASSPKPSAAPLSVAALRNAEYFRGAAAITLSEGRFTSPSPFPAEPNRYTLREDLIAQADVNGDGAEDAAVLVDFDPFGTGYFPNLVVMLNSGGSSSFAASISLDDRTRVESIRIEGARIILNLTVHGPGEARCCPTVPRTVTYRFVNGTLVQE